MLPMTSTIFSFNYYLEDGLFKDAVFPDDIDKSLVIDTIMLMYGELEPLYKDADFMQMAVTSWAAKWYHAFDRWSIALSEDYDPLHNYDRTEEWTDKTNSKVVSDATTASNRSSYDSATLQPYDSVDYDNTDTVTAGSSHDGHIYGNIGVTTSAQMLEGEITVRTNYNLYNMIADCFANELCLLVY